ncbi:MAG: hypothetical protein ACRDRW_12345 [Pseudonocardiaceae bacterium]
MGQLAWAGEAGQIGYVPSIPWRVIASPAADDRDRPSFSDLWDTSMCHPSGFRVADPARLAGSELPSRAAPAWASPAG